MKKHNSKVWFILWAVSFGLFSLLVRIYAFVVTKGFTIGTLEQATNTPFWYLLLILLVLFLWNPLLVATYRGADKTHNWVRRLLIVHIIFQTICAVIAFVLLIKQ